MSFFHSGEPIPPSNYFPDVEQSSEEGLLAIGGEIVPNTVLDALIHGIFPWPVEFGEMVGNDDACRNEEPESFGDEPTEASGAPKLLTGQAEPFYDVEWEGKTPKDLESLKDANSVLAWWSPDPRAVFELDNVHIPRRLLRTMKSGKFVVTFDRAFPEVMLGCALAGSRKREGTWITREFYQGYCKLFELGFAHSVECWKRTDVAERQNEVDGQENNLRLVGGVYGVAVNGFFDGESMFSIETDASKVALFNLLMRLKKNGFRLFDLQILNSHTKSLGGVEIPRGEYMRRLADALSDPVVF